MDELVLDDQVYISSKRAAALTGYAKDYIGQLCREGRVEARLVGRSWYVLESSVREHRFGKEESEAAPAIPEPVVERAQIPTWERANYVAEPVVTIPTMDPTYLGNTTLNDELTASEVPQDVSDMQNAWQEWFTRNEVPTEPLEPVEAESTEAQTEEPESLIDVAEE